MGDFEAEAPASVESKVKYHSYWTGVLTGIRNTGTLSGGQFDWGGRLLKRNGGAQWFPQSDWKPLVECKGIREPDCERDISSRDESRS